METEIKTMGELRDWIRATFKPHNHTNTIRSELIHFICDAIKNVSNKFNTIASSENDKLVKSIIFNSDYYTRHILKKLNSNNDTLEKSDVDKKEKLLLDLSTNYLLHYIRVFNKLKRWDKTQEYNVVNVFEADAEISNYFKSKDEKSLESIIKKLANLAIRNYEETLGVYETSIVERVKNLYGDDEWKFKDFLMGFIDTLLKVNKTIPMSQCFCTLSHFVLSTLKKSLENMGGVKNLENFTLQLFYFIAMLLADEHPVVEFDEEVLSDDYQFFVFSS